MAGTLPSFSPDLSHPCGIEANTINIRRTSLARRGGFHPRRRIMRTILMRRDEGSQAKSPRLAAISGTPVFDLDTRFAFKIQSLH
jgi:hypothetical protein